MRPKRRLHTGGCRLVLVVAFVLGLGVLGGCGGGEQPPEMDQQTPEEPARTGSLMLAATYTDTPPQRVRIDASGNPECRTDTIEGERVVVTDERGHLRDVVLAVQSGPSGLATEPEETVVDQDHCRYVPHAITAKVGQTVKVTDSDPQMHNVRASMRDSGKQLFNLTTFEGDEKEVTFEQPGIIFLECNIHPWMAGWVYVTEHGRATTTGEDGTATLEGLPVGDYTITVWHEKFEPRTREVTIEADRQAALEERFCCLD